MKGKQVRKILKRVLQSLITIVLLTIILFLLMQLIPGNPIINFLGSNATDEEIAYYTHLYGYDLPVWQQYVNWIKSMFDGTMGFSVSLQRNVSEIIFSRIGVTLTLVTWAFIVSVILGVAFGIIAALNRGKAVDTVISILSNAGIAMPVFWIGIILILIFAIRLGICPSYGYTPISKGLGPWFRGIVLPVTVLSFPSISIFARQTRSSMLDVINQDYVITAKSKGVKKRDIIFKHQLRNALVPLLTIIVNRFAQMMGATVLTENIFTLPGMGSLMINSINSRDLQLFVDCILVIAVFVTVANLIVDILYGFIDPRTKE